MLPEIEKLLTKLDTHKSDSKKYEGGSYWDDYCLAHFLQGVCLRYAAYPVSCIRFFNLYPTLFLK